MEVVPHVLRERAYSKTVLILVYLPPSAYRLDLLIDAARQLEWTDCHLSPDMAALMPATSTRLSSSRKSPRLHPYHKSSLLNATAL